MPPLSLSLPSFLAPLACVHTLTHAWLHVRSLLLVSRAVAAAARYANRLVCLRASRMWPHVAVMQMNRSLVLLLTLFSPLLSSLSPSLPLILLPPLALVLNSILSLPLPLSIQFPRVFTTNFQSVEAESTDAGGELLVLASLAASHPLSFAPASFVRRSD